MAPVEACTVRVAVFHIAENGLGGTRTATGMESREGV